MIWVLSAGSIVVAPVLVWAARLARAGMARRRSRKLRERVEQLKREFKL